MRAKLWVRGIPLLAVVFFMASCSGSDSEVAAVIEIFEEELERRVVPELQAGSNGDAVWDAFQDALVVARDTGVHLTRGSSSGVSDRKGVVRLTSVVPVIGDEESVCLAVSVRSTGAVDTMPVSGTPGRNCNDATALPF